MSFTAKLNAKFYIVSALLLCIVVLGWYGVYFPNESEILMEDGTPMDDNTKLAISIIIGVVASSWTLSLVFLMRQMVLAKAFSLESDGIYHTLTLMYVFAFLFVIPVRKIPYEAIEKIEEDDGILTLHIDKNKIDVCPILRIFVNKRYHLFAGFTKETQETVKMKLERYIKTDL